MVLAITNYDCKDDFIRVFGTLLTIKTPSFGKGVLGCEMAGRGLVSG